MSNDTTPEVKDDYGSSDRIFVPDSHDDDHALMLAEINQLKPTSKAVLVVVEADDDCVKHIVNSYGVEREWVGILGLLATGSAYCTSLMFNTDDEEEEPYEGDANQPADEAGE